MGLKPAVPTSQKVVVPRSRLLVGAAGLVCLAALVLTHALVLTALLVDSSEGSKRVMAIAVLWLLSAVAAFYIARGLRHLIVSWRAS